MSGYVEYGSDFFGFGLELGYRISVVGLVMKTGYSDRVISSRVSFDRFNVKSYGVRR